METSGLTRRRMLQLTGIGALGVASLAACGKQEEEEQPKEPENVVLTVFDPTGSVEITQEYAPRLDSYEGKTIAFVGNDMWEQKRMFEVIERRIRELYPSVTIIGAENFPQDTDKLTKVPNGITEIMQEKGVDGAIIGNAG